tara:strand:+ start:218 stop:574 length:357 start_codon:yes stop_codon:yes gene_type:complete
MSRETMKLALEALEELTVTERTSVDIERGEKAITALQEALAEQPAQQEPVAWMEMVVANLVREGVNKHKARELADHFVGLTNAQPNVPDALTIADKESADYHEGWNDCRQLMLEMRKP